MWLLTTTGRVRERRAAGTRTRHFGTICRNRRPLQNRFARVHDDVHTGGWLCWRGVNFRKNTKRFTKGLIDSHRGKFYFIFDDPDLYVGMGGNAQSMQVVRTKRQSFKSVIATHILTSVYIYIYISLVYVLVATASGVCSANVKKKNYFFDKRRCVICARHTHKSMHV